jgi:hypothetical protein
MTSSTSRVWNVCVCVCVCGRGGGGFVMSRYCVVRLRKCFCPGARRMHLGFEIIDETFKTIRKLSTRGWTSLTLFNSAHETSDLLAAHRGVHKVAFWSTCFKVFRTEIWRAWPFETTVWRTSRGKLPFAEGTKRVLVSFGQVSFKKGRSEQCVICSCRYFANADWSRFLQVVVVR